MVATKADQVSPDELDVRMALLRQFVADLEFDNTDSDEVGQWIDATFPRAPPQVVSTSALTGEGVAEMAIAASQMAQALIPSCTTAIARPGAVRLPPVNGDGIPKIPAGSQKRSTRMFCWA